MLPRSYGVPRGTRNRSAAALHQSPHTPLARKLIAAPLPGLGLPQAPHQGSMTISTSAVQSSTTQEQLKAAPLCFSFSTE